MARKSKSKHSSRSPGHSHRYIIADDQAVQTLLDKLVGAGAHRNRERLLKAVDDASRHYDKADRKQRQAFLHGLLTGYAVALKL